ncbi:IMP dehydrogenase, partial [Staphylococcus aureus]|uniref:IMP dehydrogenase n=1 Tax=Staphylococcus aureus TaxID=1280 RepID=UPI0037DA2D7E
MSTTRLLPPVPLPQITPIYHSPTQPPKHPKAIIPHRPIKFSPHIIKPLPPPPHPLILPTLLPPTQQTPPPTQIFQPTQYKLYRPIHSLAPNEKPSNHPYFQHHKPPNKFVPEPIERRTTYKPPLQH